MVAGKPPEGREHGARPTERCQGAKPRVLTVKHWARAIFRVKVLELGGCPGSRVRLVLKDAVAVYSIRCWQ